MKEQVVTQQPWARHSTQEAAPQALSTGRDMRPAFTQGIEPQERPALPGYDSGTAMLLVVIFLLVAMAFRRQNGYFKGALHDMWNTRRRRTTLFEDHTVSETGLVGLLLLITAICEGILVSTALFGSASMPHMAAATGITAVYLLGQTVVYELMGYVFNDDTGRRLLMKGFSSTQSMLGLCLVVPALLVLFSPATASGAVTIGVFFYIVARLVFVVKGFRLFYDKLYSIGYFILYLCALEIAPLLVIARLG